MKFSALRYQTLLPQAPQVTATVIICLFGLAFFVQRSHDANTMLTQITYDTLQYVSLINGVETVEPFASRFMIGLLSRMLPLSPIEAIYIINVISMFLLVFFLIKLLTLYTLSNSLSIISTVAISLTFSFSYNFTNPYLTDLPAFAAMTAALLSIHQKRLLLAVVCFSTSLFFRETAIVLLPLFLFFRTWRKFVPAFLIILAVYIVPKLIISGEIYRPELMRHEPLPYIAKTILSYGSMWALPIAAISNRPRIRDESHLFFIMVFVLSLFGSAISSLSAADTSRMYFLMAPSIAIGTCIVFNTIGMENKRQVLFLIYTLFLAITVYSLLPNIYTRDFTAHNLESFAQQNQLPLLFGLAGQLLCVSIIIKTFFTITEPDALDGV